MYVVKIKGEIGTTTTMSDEETFLLRLRNPCTDTNYVNMGEIELPQDLKYILYKYEA